MSVEDVFPQPDGHAMQATITQQRDCNGTILHQHDLVVQSH